jgi:hypothetical protein
VKLIVERFSALDVTPLRAGIDQVGRSAFRSMTQPIDQQTLMPKEREGARD